MRFAGCTMVGSCALFLMAAAMMGSAQQLPSPGQPGVGLAMPVSPAPAAAEQLDVPANPEEVRGPGMRRDPFWPVGYIPRKPESPLTSEGPMPGTEPANDPEPAVRPAAWEQAREKLDLRGVSRIGRDETTGKTRFVAMMAGKLIEEGDTVSITVDGQVYRWKVVSLSATGVRLAKLDVHAE